MFPEAFVEEHLAKSSFDGVVCDPFCGRGTTVFQSLICDRDAIGCDINPVAVCITGAKGDPPSYDDVIRRIADLEMQSQYHNGVANVGDLQEFFGLCFEEHTFTMIDYLRSVLNWQSDKTDRFIAALCLGALHGESHRNKNCFSNRMPRTISTRPSYSIRWWRKNRYYPPKRDVFSILRYVTQFRFESSPPRRRGRVALVDARDAAVAFPDLIGKVTDVITSPPYLDTTNYLDDQWLRLWFLGGEARATYPPGDGRYSNIDSYQKFLTEAWAGLAPLLARQARIVIRIGGKRLPKSDAEETLDISLNTGIARPLRRTDAVVSSRPARSQASAFSGTTPSPKLEHDFCYLVTE